MLFTFINKQVAGLQISVHDSPLVTVQNCKKHLPDHVFNVLYCKWFAFLIKIFLHIEVEVFKDEVYLVLSVHDVNEVDNAWMVELLQE